MAARSVITQLTICRLACALIASALFLSAGASDAESEGRAFDEDTAVLQQFADNDINRRRQDPASIEVHVIDNSRDSALFEKGTRAVADPEDFGVIIDAIELAFANGETSILILLAGTYNVNSEKMRTISVRHGMNVSLVAEDSQSPVVQCGGAANSTSDVTVLQIPLFEVESGGQLTIVNIQFTECSAGTLARVSDNGALVVTSSSFHSASCFFLFDSHAPPSFHVSGVASFTQCGFSCGNLGNPEEGVRLPANALTHPSDSDWLGSVVSPIFVADMAAKIELASCFTVQRALALLSNNARLESSDTVFLVSFGGPCILAVDDASAAFNGGIFQVPNVAHLRDSAALEFRNAVQLHAHGSDMAWTEGQVACAALRLHGNTSLFSEGTEVVLGRCNGLVLDDASSAVIIDNALSVNAPCEFYYFLNGSSSMHISGGSIQSPMSDFVTVAMGVHGGTSVALIERFSVSYNVTNSRQSGPLTPQFLMSDSATARFDNVSLVPDVLTSGVLFSGKHTFEASGNALLELNEISCFMCPGIVHALENATVSMTNSEFTGNNFLPPHIFAPEDLWNYLRGPDVAMGVLFAIEGSATFNGTSCRLIAMQRGLMGGVGYLSDTSRATITNFTVDTAGACDSKGGGFYVSDGAFLEIRDSTFSRVFSLCDWQSTTVGQGGFAYLEGTSHLLVRNITLREIRARKGGLLYATGTATADMSGVHVDDISAGEHGGGMYLTEHANARLSHSSFDNVFAGTEGGMFFLTGGASLAAHSFVAMNMPNMYRGGLLSASESAVGRLSEVIVGNVACQQVLLPGISDGPKVGDWLKIFLQFRTPPAYPVTIADGCAIYVSNSAAITLDSVVVQGVVSAFIGGGVLSIRDEGRISARNLSFTDVSTHGNGGAVKVSDYATFTVEDLNVTNSMAATAGACVVALGRAIVSVNGLYVINSYSPLGGGCIYADNAASVCIIGGASASVGTLHGGGFVMATGSSTVNITRHPVRQATAATGGFAFVTLTARLFLDDVDVQAANASGNGGALSIDKRAFCQITRSRFEQCVASHLGGALYVQSSATLVVLADTECNNCNAEFGAVLAATDSSSSFIVGLHVLNATASENGGALYATDNAVLSVDSSFSSGSTTEGSRGGFLAADGIAVVRMTQLLVSMASAPFGVGGAISVRGQSQVNITSSIFTDVSGSIAGGFLHQSGLSTAHVSGVEVHGAWTDGIGAGIVVRGAARLFIESTTLVNAQRPRGLGVGWFSAAPDSVGSYVNVKCINCTEELFVGNLMYDYEYYVNPNDTYFGPDAFLPDSEEQRELEGVFSSDYVLSFILQGYRYYAEQHQTVVNAVIDTERAFGTEKVDYTNVAMRIHSVAAITYATVSDSIEISVFPSGRLTLQYAALETSPVTVDGTLYLLDVAVVESPIVVRGSGWLHCDGCTFASNQSRRRRDANGDGLVEYGPLIVMTDETFAAFVNLVIGAYAATTGNGGFASVSNAAVISVNKGDVGSIGSAGNGGFVSAEVLSVGEQSTPRISIDGVIVANCHAGGDGGMLWIRDHAVASVRNTVISLSRAQGSGGLIYAADSAVVTVDKTSIRMSSSGGNGGVFSLIGAVSATLASVNVSGSSSGANGGLAALSPIAGASGVPSLAIDKLSVDDLSSGANGGAFFSSGSHIHVGHSVFTGLRAAALGGLVHVAGDTASDIVVDECTFDDVTTAGHGGLVSLTDTSSALMRRCHGNHISSDLDGGAFYVEKGSMTVKNSTFANCLSNGGGGSIAINGGVIRVETTSFTNTTSDLGGGLALLQSLGEAIFTDVSVVGSNTNSVGGGVFYMAGRSRLNVDGISIRRSSALGLGGALSADGRASAVINRMDLRDSVTTFGHGGFAAVVGNARLVISNSTALNTSCDEQGGFVYMNGAATVDLSNVTISGVSSLTDGGAIAVLSKGKVKLSNVSISRASAALRGGLAYVGSFADLTADGVTVSGSSAADGGVLHVDSTASASITGATVSNASAAGNGGCMYSKSSRLVVTDSSFTGCSAGVVSATYGQGGFLYLDAEKASDVVIHSVSVSNLHAASAPVIFSSTKLGISADSAFSRVGSRDALFGNASAAIATPAATLLVSLSSAVPAASRRRGLSDSSIGAVPLFPTQRSGESLPSFSVLIVDAYGLPAFASPSVPLAIRLVVRNDSASGSCTLAGDLTRTFSRISRVDYSNVRISSATVPADCTVVIIPDNFLYSEEDALFRSQTPQTVRLAACASGTSLENDASTGQFSCVSSAVPAAASSSNSTVIIAVVVSLVFVSLAVFGAAYLLVRRNRRRWNMKQIEDFAKHMQNAQPDLARLELPRDAIDLKEILGEGAFGVVHKAQVVIGSRMRPCAVKTLKSNVSVEQRIEFISEAEIMMNLHHENVVNMVGVVTDGDPMFIVLEFAAHGSLKSFLSEMERHRNSNRRINYNEIFAQIAGDVADGMAYLAQQSIAHKDLAARNVMISNNPFGDFQAKVADFGLSRDLGGREYYKKSKRGMVPVKWSAIESLVYGVWSTKSDVWSYGVVLWETWTFGQNPYPGISNSETLAHVQNGGRLEMPSDCPQHVYDVMVSCWCREPDERPTFAMLAEMFAKIRNDWKGNNNDDMGFAEYANEGAAMVVDRAARAVPAFDWRGRPSGSYVNFAVGTLASQRDDDNAADVEGGDRAPAAMGSPKYANISFPAQSTRETPRVAILNHAVKQSPTPTSTPTARRARADTYRYAMDVSGAEKEAARIPASLTRPDKINPYSNPEEYDQTTPAACTEASDDQILTFDVEDEVRESGV